MLNDFYINRLDYLKNMSDQEAADILKTIQFNMPRFSDKTHKTMKLICAIVKAIEALEERGIKLWQKK